ncbi:tetratricopeptide repeat-containing sensor histidine kinase [Hymenobacter psychrotolerans]|uniref:histidine kinase n=1 Tax=Hymenobacter psychrotolerans DSM 18569 TaxID=1121959 RepID=A0A1M7H2V1_9BACT|nr:tetratricopeptide repeat protein [Hymenobacter psychrotolerans]SHM22861.1 Signal transduction histidine kinase [Hymenobacter psychrotolerans DSM 18569]
MQLWFLRALPHRLWLAPLAGLLWLAPAAAQAQPDSTPSAGTAVTRHLQQSEQLLPIDPVAAQLQAEQALHLAAVSGPPTDVGAAYLAIGEALQARQQHEQALVYFRRGLRLYQKLRSAPGRARALRQLARAQHLQGDTGQAYDTYRQALRLTQRLRDPAGLAQVHTQLGDLYGAQGQWARALSSYERAYSDWQQARNLPGQAAALNAIGLAHHRLRNYSRALYYLRRSLNEALQLGDSTRTGEALASTGQVYEEVGNYEVAMTFYTQALSTLPLQTPPARRAAGLQVLAVAQDSLANRPAAIRALQRALPLARRGGSVVQISKIYQTLSDLHRREGSYEAALQAQLRYAGLQDSVFAAQRSAQIAELQTRYETEKKEREIQLLTKDQQIQTANLRRQMLLRNGLAIGTLLLLLAVVALYRGRREQARVNRLLQRKNRAISRQKEELGRLNRTKDTLFSIISHDLRSPLSSLYSMFSLLALGTLPPERMALHTERLKRTLDVTLRLLDNLLNWSAAQMQSDKISPERVHMPVLTEEALALLLGDAERKSILFLTELPDSCIVCADVNMVRLVLRNLVANAIKFTPEGGTITIAAKPVQGQWEISVADTGLGIRPEDFPKIFGEGGHHSTLGTANEKGTGLGLRLCKDFVERNGGRITFESSLNKGTTFRFTLPAAEMETLPLLPPGPPATIAAAG